MTNSHPLILSAEESRAVNEGRKTQHRVPVMVNNTICTNLREPIKQVWDFFD